MAVRKARGPQTQLAFEALAIEGGLLSADWLARVAQQKAGGQSDAEYRVPKGINLRDDIGRYWRIAQAHWTDFSKGRAANAEPRALAEAFVHTLLRECFGFVSLEKVPPLLIKDRTYPVGAMALGSRVPVVVAPAGLGLDAPSSALGDGTRKRSAFGLAQELLNASDDAMWGIASDGVTLRILRDNASLTRPAWIEADLARIFAEERFADFAALWLLAHETRFGSKDLPPQNCHLETWRSAGREEGTRAREDLRKGVEDALLALGNGFLAHAGNANIRGALESGALTKEALFQELLRLVYRLIFLLTAEERGVLHDPSASEAAKALYDEGYGIRRLRDRSARRNAYDRFGDVWESLKIVLRGLSRGEARLGLPALGGLFDADQCPTLDAAKLENRALLLAVFRLSWLKEDGSLSRVNWRDMGPEELGSVYESLLELMPLVTEGSRKFSFAMPSEAEANARKGTGSFYTKESLVHAVLDSALEPVVDDTIAKNPGRARDALLGLSIVDPACGSGHFLLAAARRLAAHIARIEANGTASAEQYRHAVRQVVGRCIFGVDLNPMAVELCKVSLWMEAVEPGRPLSFLDSHIQHGNALLGATPELLAKGIPDSAWKVIDDVDDTQVAAALREQNKKERVELSLNLSPPPASTYARLGAGARAVDEATDETLDAVVAKENTWRDLLESLAYEHQRFVADAWCAAFVWKKQPGTRRNIAPTESCFLGIQRDRNHATEELRSEVTDLRKEYGFFHWHLAFPQVMAKGGFDVVLGNPPWDTLSPDAKEFFSAWDAGVRFLSPEDQERAIARLMTDSAVGPQWKEHCRHLYASVFFMKNSGRYTLFAPGNLGKGDFNVYRMFVETALRVVRPGGRVSQLVPEGLYNGANCMAIRSELFERCSLTRLFGFENHRHVWFDGPDTRMKFALYSAQVPGRTDRFRVAFNIRSEDALRSCLAGEALDLPVALVREFSPDALALMELGSQRDIDIAAKMYAAHPKFGDTSLGPPRRHYMRELDMGNDRDLFDEDARGIPLYEGRMVAQYDHRAKGYRSGRGRQAEWEDLPFSNPAKSIQPQWRIAPAKLPEKVELRHRQYRIGFCDVASPTNERTLVATIIPREAVCGHKVPTIVFDGAPASAYCVWLAVANSFAVDFLARKKVSLSMTYTILDSLPFPRLATDDSRVGFLVSRVARLVCTSAEMTGFWNALAAEGFVTAVPENVTAPGELDDAQRSILMAELDAFIANELFGLTREELEYVLDTFPIVEKHDRKLHGEYRTRRIILESYDAMAEAARSGRPYVTRLGPPPADPRVAHPPRAEKTIKTRKG